jgi:OmpA-OmpF porin, OOP family
MTLFDPETARPSGFLIGVGGALLAMLLGLLGPHDGAVWRVPQVLKQRVATALLASGYPGLNVEMAGQRALLSGVVEDQADIARATRAALVAAGGGGPWAGGVTSVHAFRVSVGPFERPYVWIARREPSRIVLSGAAPSEAVRADLQAMATQTFPGAETVNDMQVAGGAASPAFADVARTAVRALAGLHIGEARIVDRQIVIIGDGNQAGVDALHAAFARPPAPFRVRLDVTVEGLDPDHPELQGLNLASGDPDTCERAFGRLMERNTINFATGSAVIEPSSRDVLDSLASVALRCDRFSIEVAGHTDNQGPRDLNMDLSRRRADAVVAYLASQGVARSRLGARGLGPDRPRQTNATEAGQAANRRIEFSVSG